MAPPAHVEAPKPPEADPPEAGLPGSGPPESGPGAEVAETVPARARVERPVWWTQLAVIVFGLWVYDLIANLSPLRRALAMANGLAIFRFEERFHMDWELALNKVLIAHQGLGRVLADYYNLGHWIVTLVILGWVYSRHAGHFRMLRNSLVVMNAIALVVFWVYPVAPPRMFPSLGFVDIGIVTHSFGSATQNSAIAAHANEFAAIPSLHVAWALWCVFAVWTICRDRWSRGLVALHFLATSVVIMATANHYFLDIVAGIATGVAGIMAARAWQKRRERKVGSAIPLSSPST